MSAQTRARDGLYGNVVNGGQEFDDLDRQAYRLALRWEPNAVVTVDYGYDESRLDDASTPERLVGLNRNPRGSLPFRSLSG